MTKQYVSIDAMGTPTLYVTMPELQLGQTVRIGGDNYLVVEDCCLTKEPKFNNRKERRAYYAKQRGK